MIKLIVLDELVARNEIRAPDFIKVDVEGDGANALRGAAQSIRLSRPTIVMSFHSQDELIGSRNLLAPLGYSPVSICDSPRPWEECLYRTATLRSKNR